MLLKSSERQECRHLRTKLRTIAREGDHNVKGRVLCNALNNALEFVGITRGR